MPEPSVTTDAPAKPGLAPQVSKSRLAIVGQPILRLDAAEKVLGQTKYCDDFEVDGALHGKLLRAAYPHAIVRSIDVGDARNLPGVAIVLTHEDVPGRRDFGYRSKDQPVLAYDRVRYLGDVVAAVAAESEEIARQAIRLIKVEYEPLPVVEDPMQALADDAPKIHESGNVALHYKVRKGDVDAAFARADVILDRTYRTPYVDHAPLEVVCAIASPTPDGGVRLLSSSQLPHAAGREVAAVLGIDPAKVSIQFTMTGGAFGGKEDSAIDACCRAAVLAYCAGRPVRLIYDREESLLSHAKRHPMTFHYRTAATRDGTILGVEVKLYVEQGAYRAHAELVTKKAATHAAGAYEIPNVRVDAFALHTNNPPTGAMRGVGAPQATFAYECQIDELAEQLEIDPLTIRLLNGFHVGSITATGQRLEASVGLKETLERASARAGFLARWARFRGQPEQGRIARGVGIACCFFGLGRGTGTETGTGVIRARPDGKIEVDCGAGEVGQGSMTVFAQIAAEALDLPLDQIVVLQPDTARSPDYGTTSASRATTVGGNGVLIAAIAAREELIRDAAIALGVEPDQLTWDRGLVCTGGKSTTVAELIKARWSRGAVEIARKRWIPPDEFFDLNTGQGDPYFVYAYVTTVAEVAVDRATGEVKVERLTVAQDVGKAINPAGVAGQIEGGTAMGLGFALMEEQRWVQGRPGATNLHTFLIPTSADVPPIDSIIVEDPSPFGPFGAKGAGEPPVCTVAPAVVNAVANAVGVRIRALPLTAEKVLREARAQTR